MKRIMCTICSLLLSAVLLVGGCECFSDTRVRLEPGSKVDRQSELYQDLLLKIIRFRIMEHELQEYHKWADRQDFNGVTYVTEQQR